MTIRPLFRFSLILFIFSMAACNPKDNAEIEKSASVFDIAQGKASITQSNLNFMKAFKAGDSTSVADSYAKDAKIMPPNRSAILGKIEIKKFISSLMNSPVKDFQLTTINVWGDSSILAEEGTYVLSDSLEKQLDKGEYLVLWKPEAGNWKMFRDIWTSDLLPVDSLPKE
ncbi:MAG: ketosteroid isomerase family protein [Ginsengibacter sp.]